MGFLPSRVEKHKARWLLAAVVVALLLCGAVFGDHGVFHLTRLRVEQRDLEDVAFELQQRNDRLRSRIDRLRDDDLYLEKLARERLGMTRPNEVIYRVLPTPSPSATGASADEPRP
jgi:cell division protein FtsB